MTDKIYDNAKLTKLVNRLLNPPVETKKVTVIPDLLHFSVTGEYSIPLPAGTILVIRAFVVANPTLDDKDKKELEINFRYREAGQLTTKTIEVKGGLNNAAINTKISSDAVTFFFDTAKVASASITVTFLPTERVEV